MPDVHIPGDGHVKYKDQVYLVFDQSGNFKDTDPSAFNPHLPHGHFAKGDRKGPYTADNHDHDDDYNFEPDDGEGPRVMNTIHIRSTTEGGGKLTQLDNIGDVETTTKNLITHVVTTLQGNAAVKAAGPPRLFFPNGIDSISVIVKVGVIDVEISVSGPPASTDKLSSVESSS